MKFSSLNLANSLWSTWYVPGMQLEFVCTSGNFHSHFAASCYKRMKCVLVLFLIVACSLASATESYCNQTWYTYKDGDCACGVELSGDLRCNDCYKTVDIAAGFCMTYDITRHYVGENSSSLLIVGDCPYGALSNRKFNTLATN